MLKPINHFKATVEIIRELGPGYRFRAPGCDDMGHRQSAEREL
nr:C843 [uncultured bacterium]